MTYLEDQLLDQQFYNRGGGVADKPGGVLPPALGATPATDTTPHAGFPAHPVQPKYLKVTRRNPRTGQIETVLMDRQKALAFNAFREKANSGAQWFKTADGLVNRDTYLNRLAQNQERKYGFGIYGYGNPHRRVVRRPAAAAAAAGAAGTPAQARPVRHPLSPLQQAVNSAITGMVTPWQQAQGTVQGQQNYLNAYGNRMNTGLQAYLAQLGQEGTANSGEMLAAAAQANDASGAAFRKQMDFLRSVAGGTPGDTYLQGGLNAINQSGIAANAADSRNVASELALRDASQRQFNQGIAQSAALGNTEWKRGAMQPLAATRAQMAAQIAAIRAQGPALARVWGQEDKDYALKQEEMAFQREQFQQAIRQWQREFNAGRADARTANINNDAALQAQIDAAAADAGGSDGSPGGDGKPSVYGFKIANRYNTRLDKILELVRMAGNKAEYRDTVHDIRAIGVTKVQAVLLAAKWLQRTGRLQIGGPKQLRKTMGGYGVSDVVQKQVFAMAGFPWGSWRTQTSATVPNGVGTNQQDNADEGALGAGDMQGTGGLNLEPIPVLPLPQGPFG